MVHALCQKNKKRGCIFHQFKNEKQEKTIRELRNEIDTLLKDIENAPISADIKAKLLVRESLQKQKSLFKKKLMECFSYD